MFYLGYILFEVPSNLLMRRFGARKWIARIMITWGLVSAATMFARDLWTFYALRILLGVAEAGFFPGIILYLSDWFPDRQAQAKMTAFFMLAIGLSNVFGNPVSGWIMEHFDGVNGTARLAVAVFAGRPADFVGLGSSCLVLPERLSERRRVGFRPTNGEWLVDHLAEEDRQRQAQHGPDRWGAMLQPRVWLLIAIYFTSGRRVERRWRLLSRNSSRNSITTWPPTFQIGLLTRSAAVAPCLGRMTLVGISSDRTE